MLALVKKKWLQFVLGFVVVFVFTLSQKGDLLFLHSLAQGIDGIFYDAMVNAGVPKKNDPSEVIIVDIDDESIQAIGRWPWSRDTMARLLNQLKDLGIAVVAFDIVMAESEVNQALGLKDKILNLQGQDKDKFQPLVPLLNQIAPSVDSDQAFARALPQNDVVLGYLFHFDDSIKKGMLPPPLQNAEHQVIDARGYLLPTFTGYNGILPLFAKVAPAQGFVSNLPDVDKVIRHGQLLGRYDNKIYASLSLATVMRYLFADTITIHSHHELGHERIDAIEVGGVKIAVNEKGQMLIPYWGPGGTFPYYSAKHILFGEVDKDDVMGRIAVVGSSTVLLADRHNSPVGQTFPGAEMVASMIAGMITEQVVSEFNWSSLQGLLLFAGIGLIFVSVLPLMPTLLLGLTFFCTLIFVLVGSIAVLAFGKIYIPVANLLAMVICQTLINFIHDFVLERRQKNQIRNLFSQYVPPSYVLQITNTPELLSMEGEARELTIFFGDIRNFTTMSESLEPTKLKLLLNEFFTPITGVIFEHQGTIDKYVGDLVMAFWGAPLSDPHHREHGVEAAIEILKQLPKISEELTQKGLPSIAMGMGLHTGVVNVGDMGSRYRRSYTVIGDAVNLASRLQDLTKYYGVDVLLSEESLCLEEQYLWQYVDKVAVKGRSGSIKIYTYYGASLAVAADELAALEQYHLAIRDYYQQDFAAAKYQFESLQERSRHPLLCQLYAKRAEHFLSHPPPSDWDGTFIHTSK